MTGVQTCALPILQMLQMGYIEIAYNENNHLKVTESGSNILFGKKEAQLVTIKRTEIPPKEKGRKKKEPQSPSIFTGSNANEDKDLFQELRELRLRLASHEAIPPYIVFSDKVLHLLAAIQPTTIEAFGEINGVGEIKKNKYGKDFINLIKKHQS